MPLCFECKKEKEFIEQLKDIVRTLEEPPKFHPMFVQTIRALKMETSGSWPVQETKEIDLVKSGEHYFVRYRTEDVDIGWIAPRCVGKVEQAYSIPESCVEQITGDNWKSFAASIPSYDEGHHVF